MKKQLLMLSLLPLLAITGCSGDAVSSSTGEESSSDSSSQSQESTSSSSESSSSSSSSSSEEPKTLVATIDFSNVTQSAGHNFVDNPDDFSAYLPDEVVTSFSLYKVFAQDPSDETGVRMTLGSSSEAGTIALELNVEVSRVEIVCQDYYRYIAYTDSWNNDMAKVGVFDTQLELSHASGSASSVETLAFDGEATSNLTISGYHVEEGTSCRVFIEAIRLYA